MARRALPRPTRRKNSQTWEIRTRIDGKIRTKTLGTRDFDEALRRVPDVFNNLVLQHESKPVAPPVTHETSAPAKVTKLTDPASACVSLSTDEICEMYRNHRRDCERKNRLELGRNPDQTTVQLSDVYDQQLEDALVRARADLRFGQLGSYQHFLTHALSSKQRTIENEIEALNELAKAEVALLKEFLSDVDELPTTPATSVPHSAANSCSTGVVAPPAPTLKAVLEDFIVESSTGLKGTRATEIRAVVRDFCDVVGDKPVTDYGKTDARTFKSILLALPANRTKKRELRNLDIVAAANKAKELGMPRQSGKTIQMKRGMLRKVFAFAAAEYENVTNPFDSAASWNLTDASAADQRDAFSDAELSLLLNSNLNKSKNHLYWLTWLGLCTGARLNELCQLTTQNIRNKPIPHLILDKSIQLKSPSSIRSIPLHSKLINLGFLGYVDKCRRNEGQLLFPGLPRRHTNRYSDAPSKAFGRHLGAMDLKRSGLSFHSLRHTFIAKFKKVAPQHVEIRERLVGHVVAGVAGRYGQTYESEAEDADLLLKRAETLETLDFEHDN